MLKRPVLLACVGLAALSGGCGTLLNTTYFTPEEGGERAYGGVRLDAEAIQDGLGQQSALATTLFLIDLPFAVLGDTLTLPYILALSARQTAKPEPKSPEAAPAGGPTQQAGAAQPRSTSPSRERLDGAIGP